MRGSSVAFDLSAFDRPLDAINALAAETAALSDHELEGRARGLGDQIRAGARLGDVRVPFFALTREAAHRALGLRPFDVQLIAALAMDRSAVVDMQTGEGKTLAAVMPAALNALAGRGVHVLTVTTTWRAGMPSGCDRCTPGWASTWGSSSRACRPPCGDVRTWPTPRM